MKKEISLEKEHLEQCKEIIRNNIEKYDLDLEKSEQQIKDLFYEIHEGNIELFNQVSIDQSIEEHVKSLLERNQKAFKNPYFGRIDYTDYKENKEEKLYIGKRGIVEGNTKIVIVDWRAPISSVYYESEKGESSYFVTEEERRVNLQLKRSFDIEDAELKGFFDSDVTVNDELLIKYLSQNKEVILNDIIATIQQEQNKIIRTNPFCNIIVQGVAGSGKTSVIIHRIAYILYNYAERFVPGDFCIIGSSDNLVNYIASGLPELDVHNVKFKRMDEIFPYLLGKYWKKRYRIQVIKDSQEYKSKIEFIKALDKYLLNLKENRLPLKTLTDKRLGRLLKEENNVQLAKEFKEKSYNQILTILDDRLRLRIISSTGEYSELRNQKIDEYKKYYERKKYVGNLTDIYTQFLEVFGNENNINLQENIIDVNGGKFDVYDTVALLLIYYRFARTEDIEDFEQIFIDEAQDFGASVYYVLKTVLPKCYFNIVGDVSQNINFHTGMNDWKDIIVDIFNEERDRFLCLSKSYRNTIEISDFAGKILDCIEGEKYKIDPVIRHGESIKIINTISWQEGIAAVEDNIVISKEKGYKTIAVICFTEEERNYVKKKLEKRAGESLDRAGVSILTIEETKGLEFDVAIIWKPELERYPQDTQYAKKLYVAVTRALHELYLIK